MSTSQKPNKATVLADVRALIAGTQKHTPNGSFTFGNATYSTASLVQLFQSLVDAMTAQDAADAAAKDALLAVRNVDSTVLPIVQAYRRFLVATYGNATQVLADYGAAPPKARTPLSVEALASALQRRRATRTARHTLGPKQKKAIKGTVTTTPGALPIVATTGPTKPTS